MSFFAKEHDYCILMEYFNAWPSFLAQSFSKKSIWGLSGNFFFKTVHFNLVKSSNLTGVYCHFFNKLK